jgi:pimeloyl-ACP methyl ester carboxylesterase
VPWDYPATRSTNRSTPKGSTLAWSVTLASTNCWRIGGPRACWKAPRSWAERAYPGNLIHYNRLDRGGHFAAWEQPDLFAGEMRASFRSLR